MASWQIYLLEFPFQESESHKCELKSLWLTIYCELRKLTMKKKNPVLPVVVFATRSVYF